MGYTVELQGCLLLLQSPLLKSIPEIEEIGSIVRAVEWQNNKRYEIDGKFFEHQKGYNRQFETEFSNLKWEPKPKLLDLPRLIGDFRKNDVFVEVQFGNSSALFRDYYKFHYGLTHGLLSIAVLIVPTDPIKFFPTRPRSVSNMAE